MKFTITTENLRQALRCVVYAAAKPKDSKAFLACVRIAIVDGGVDFVATNGSWLARWREPAVDIEGGDTIDAISITVDTAKRITKMAAMRVASSVEINLSACTLRVLEDVVVLDTVTATFPAYNMVIPS